MEFDQIEELTQIDSLKIVQINWHAFSRLAYSRDVYTQFRCSEVVFNSFCYSTLRERT